MSHVCWDMHAYSNLMGCCVQAKKAYVKSKQILPFGFARHRCAAVCQVHSVLQYNAPHSKKVVSAYFTSKQIPPFGFAL